MKQESRAPAAPQDVFGGALGMSGSDPTGGFEDFYLGSRDRVYRSVIALTGDQHDAEDCTAEAFSRSFQAWDSIRNHPAPDAWVVRTAVNLHADRRRSAQRGLRLAPKLVDGHVPPPAVSLDPVLMAAIADLPDRQRQVLVLRILLELSTDETASELGISPNTVGVHLHRALAALRQHVFTTSKDES